MHNVRRQLKSKKTFLSDIIDEIEELSRSLNNSRAPKKPSDQEVEVLTNICPNPQK